MNIDAHNHMVATFIFMNKIKYYFQVNQCDHFQQCAELQLFFAFIRHQAVIETSSLCDFHLKFKSITHCQIMAYWVLPIITIIIIYYTTQRSIYALYGLDRMALVNEQSKQAGRQALHIKSLGYIRFDVFILSFYSHFLLIFISLFFPFFKPIQLQLLSKQEPVRYIWCLYINILMKITMKLYYYVID